MLLSNRLLFTVKKSRTTAPSPLFCLKKQNNILAITRRTYHVTSSHTIEVFWNNNNQVLFQEFTRPIKMCHLAIRTFRENVELGTGRYALLHDLGNFLASSGSKVWQICSKRANDLVMESLFPRWRNGTFSRVDSKSWLESAQISGSIFQESLERYCDKELPIASVCSKISRNCWASLLFRTINNTLCGVGPSRIDPW